MNDAIRRLRELDAKLIDPELMLLIFEHLPDAVIMIDNTSRIIQLVNRQAEILTGYPRRDLFDQPLDILIPTRQRAVHQTHVTGYFAAPRPRAMGVGLILAIRHKAGALIPVTISLSPITLRGNLYVLAAIRPIRAPAHGGAGSDGSVMGGISPAGDR